MSEYEAIDALTEQLDLIDNRIHEISNLKATAGADEYVLIERDIEALNRWYMEVYNRRAALDRQIVQRVEQQLKTWVLAITESTR